MGNPVFRRKIYKEILEWKEERSEKYALLIKGARRVGKSTIVEEFAKKEFKSYILIDFAHTSKEITGLFDDMYNLDFFFLQLQQFTGVRLYEKESVIIFDEVQLFPRARQAIKYLVADGRYKYIETGSLLSIKKNTRDILIPSEEHKISMYPMDFEEFLYANGMNEFVISTLRNKFNHLEELDESLHNKMMDLFKKYLLVGGLPDAVNTYLSEKNIVSVRNIQAEIHEYYASDASKYSFENKLKISRIYDLIPSNMENKKKRVVVKNIEGKRGKTFNDYQEEFEYLVSAGIALNVQAISNPKFPLIESASKNLIKLYLNDVGILTGILYGNNINAILDDQKSINLGSVYETIVASELKAHGKKLYYYDNRNKGEVDFLIDDYDSLSVVPIEVKSGKDYTVHSALNNFVNNEDYHIQKGYVVSNERTIRQKGKIIYLPIYYTMFF